MGGSLYVVGGFGRRISYLEPYAKGFFFGLSGFLMASLVFFLELGGFKYFCVCTYNYKKFYINKL